MSGSEDLDRRHGRSPGSETTDLADFAAAADLRSMSAEQQVDVDGQCAALRAVTTDHLIVSPKGQRV